MDAAELKKRVKELIKEKARDLDFPEFEKKISLNGCKIYEDKKEIGLLDLAYVTSKSSEYGSLFGVYAQCIVNGGKVASVLERLALSYPKFGQMPGYFTTTSLSEKVKRFGEQGGIISFYEKDDIEEKCSKIIQKLNSIYVPKINNFILGKIEVVDDIITSPMDYAYPMASIVVACYLNDKKEMLDEVIKTAKSKKLYDAGSKRVEEVLERVEGYFNKGVC